MKTGFIFEEGRITSTSIELANIIVYIVPDESEKQQVIEALGLDQHDLESALDPDELSRIEFESDGLSLIWKRPKTVSVEEQLKFDVASLGLFLREDKLIVIMNENLGLPFSSKEFRKAGSLMDILMQFLLHTVHHYVGHLKVIKQLTGELGSKISDSMQNRYFLQMLVLGESLIYYQNAIEGNGAVLTKLRANAEKLNLSEQQISFLHDVTLDNKQCARQAQIYSTVLSGLMDARGTIINNNVNTLLKNLTVINIIFLPLNLIASIGGMSEYSMWTQHIDWKISYSIFTLIMILVGWVTWGILVRFLNIKKSD